MQRDWRERSRPEALAAWRRCMHAGLPWPVDAAPHAASDTLRRQARGTRGRADRIALRDRLLLLFRLSARASMILSIPSAQTTPADRAPVRQQPVVTATANKPDCGRCQRVGLERSPRRVESRTMQGSSRREPIVEVVRTCAVLLAARQAGSGRRGGEDGVSPGPLRRANSWG